MTFGALHLQNNGNVSESFIAEKEREVQMLRERQHRLIAEDIKEKGEKYLMLSKKLEEMEEQYTHNLQLLRNREDIIQKLLQKCDVNDETIKEYKGKLSQVVRVLSETRSKHKLKEAKFLSEVTVLEKRLEASINELRIIKEKNDFQRKSFNNER